MSKFSIVFLIALIFLNCTKSGRRKSTNTNENLIENNNTIKIEDSNTKNIIKMEKKDGVYYIPIEINGVSMHFIFDTGAGMISMSAMEANFLYKQGKLTEDDFLGKANYMDANGYISEGTIVNLRFVKVGNKTLENIKASIVHNMEAPLLLGQTVLEGFGKISIDYNTLEITFE
jgi:aspartyl protease family protein